MIRHKVTNQQLTIEAFTLHGTFSGIGNGRRRISGVPITNLNLEGATSQEKEHIQKLMIECAAGMLEASGICAQITITKGLA